jgi:hypothetical protein
MTQESAEEKGQENSDDSVQGDAPESAQEAIPVESEETAPEMTPENSEETVQESVQEAVASAPDETVEESAVETVPVKGKERAPNALEEKKWYVIHTYSGYEQKVKVSLFDQFEHSDCKENLAEIVIPTEKVFLAIRMLELIKKAHLHLLLVTRVGMNDIPLLFFQCIRGPLFPLNRNRFHRTFLNRLIGR